MKAEHALVNFLIEHPRIRYISFKPCLLEFERAIAVNLSIVDAEGFERYGDHKIITYTELLYSELLPNENFLIDTLEAMAKKLEDAWPQLDESDD